MSDDVVAELDRAREVLTKCAQGYKVAMFDFASGAVLEVQGSGYDTRWEVRLRLKPLKDALAVARAEGLEAAALVCETRAERSLAGDACANCAAAIRALKGEH